MNTRTPSSITRWNLDQIEAQYQQWQQDPSSVEEDWQYFFAGMELAMERPIDEDGDSAEPMTTRPAGSKPPGRLDQQRDDHRPQRTPVGGAPVSSYVGYSIHHSLNRSYVGRWPTQVRRPSAPIGHSSISGTTSICGLAPERL